MTVSLSPKHDVSKTDDNDNETCCSDKECEHTEPPLQDIVEKSVIDRNRSELYAKSDMNKGDIYCQRTKKICSFHEAPEFLKHNSYILTGYRGTLDTKQCIESIFWWTNETINIWSHIFGFVLFFAASIRDFASLEIQADTTDKLLVGFVLICFQVCMLLSASYHTFSCRSARDCDVFLTYDLLGIALSLFAIYISGIYYAFWCEPGLLNFYTFTVTVIFVIAMSLHVPRFNVGSNVKMLVFVGWALYGVIPTIHWAIHMGWFENPLVCLLLPRVVGMYVISGVAFFIYITKIPERFCSGKFDYLGHSHQWWHLLVLAALYYWHSSGIIYLEYRFNHVCASRSAWSLL